MRRAGRYVSSSIGGNTFVALPDIDIPKLRNYVDDLEISRRGPVNKHEKTNSPREADTTSSGVDLSLIRWFLSLSPVERLRTVENYAASINKIRDDRHNS